MKRFILCFISVILFSSSVSFAKSFDLSFLPGLKKGLTMKQVCALLDRDSIKYEIKNNTVGGKFIKVEDVKIKYQTMTISGVNFGFNKGKLSSFIAYVLDDCSKLYDYFDNISNCKFEYDDTVDTYYYFDNGMLIYDNINDGCKIRFSLDNNKKCP